LVVLGSLETLEIKEKKVYPDSLASPELKDHLDRLGSAERKVTEA
jgi:hypothetical protein